MTTHNCNSTCIITRTTRCNDRTSSRFIVRTIITHHRISSGEVIITNYRISSCLSQPNSGAAKWRGERQCRETEWHYGGMAWRWTAPRGKVAWRRGVAVNVAYDGMPGRNAAVRRPHRRTADWPMARRRTAKCRGPHRAGAWRLEATGRWPGSGMWPLGRR